MSLMYHDWHHPSVSEFDYEESVVRIHSSPEGEDEGECEREEEQSQKTDTTDAPFHTSLYSAGLGQLPPVEITYSGIKFGVDVKKGKLLEHRQILKGIDGVFRPGKFTAVMGASGAGKTSLLNLVSGNPTAGRSEGKICLNGIDVFDSMSRIRELSAFIQQDDILLGTQTVREAIILSARLRLPKSMPDEEKLRRVDDVIEILGLTKCKDTLVGDNFNKGISGGEKRRVSVALELIKSPAVLFLDEPTSGLDTFTAHSIIGLLRDIAHTQGKTIVCTIHQPSSDVFHMFDDLVLLADGEIMYQGDASHCVEYFAQRGLVCPENYNPADYLFHSVLYSMDAQLNMISEDMKHSLQSSSKKGKHLNLNSPTQTDSTMESRQLASKAAYEQMQKDEKKRVASLLQEWLSSKEYSEVQSQISHPLSTRLPDPITMRAERPGEFYAFQLLSQRRWHDLLRDRMKLRVQFSQYVFFGIVLGLIFLNFSRNQNSVQNRTGFLFFVCVQSVFMSFMSNLNTFGPEKVVMMREMESGMYGLPAFFFSRWIVELPFRIIFPFTYAVIVYWMTGLQDEGSKFILFAITLILLDNCGTNLAVMICSIFPDLQTAMQAGPAFMMPLMIFSGFYINLGSLGWWFKWIAYISPVRYGFGSVIKNEMYGLTFSCEPGQSCIPTGEDQIRLLSIEDDPSVGLNIGILVILVGAFLMGAFAFMYRTTKRR